MCLRVFRNVTSLNNHFQSTPCYRLSPGVFRNDVLCAKSENSKVATKSSVRCNSCGGHVGRRKISKTSPDWSKFVAKSTSFIADSHSKGFPECIYPLTSSKKVERDEKEGKCEGSFAMDNLLTQTDLFSTSLPITDCLDHLLHSDGVSASQINRHLDFGELDTPQ